MDYSLSGYRSRSYFEFKFIVVGCSLSWYGEVRYTLVGAVSMYNFAFLADRFLSGFDNYVFFCWFFSLEIRSCRIFEEFIF